MNFVQYNIDKKCLDIFFNQGVYTVQIKSQFMNIKSNNIYEWLKCFDSQNLSEIKTR